MANKTKNKSRVEISVEKTRCCVVIVVTGIKRLFWWISYS